MSNVQTLGQVFSPPNIVDQMLALRRNQGPILEPSAGDGAFYNVIPDCVGIEIDRSLVPEGGICCDFFSYPTTEKFDTIIGNPPYVAYKHIESSTKDLLPSGYDKRTNLYVFFIDKCLDHLNEHGEIIFITPREFLQATSARRLNERLYSLGTITNLINLGDKPIFKGYSPNTVIWRFEKDNFSRNAIYDGDERYFKCHGNGILTFENSINDTNNTLFGKLFHVHVGGVSGLDSLFANEVEGDVSFVYSQTRSTGETRKMIYVDSPTPYLEQHKQELINRRIKKFNESNWWQWGRGYYLSNKPRVYVNCKTRVKNPFFVHNSIHYDGSVLAIFPYDTKLDCIKIAGTLNQFDWNKLGFVCDGRHIFTQRLLEKMWLPHDFTIT